MMVRAMLPDDDKSRGLIAPTNFHHDYIYIAIESQ